MIRAGIKAFCITGFLLWGSVNNTLAQWTSQVSGTSELLTSIDFVDENLGYCSSENGVLHKTTNGGLNWNVIGNCEAQKIRFINPDTGFSYYAFDLFLTDYHIYKTTDGGNSWVSKLISLTGGFYAIDFPTAMIGFTANRNATQDSIYVYKTIDCGENWSVSSIIPVDAESFCIYFQDVNTGFLTEDNHGRIYKTTNGGTNWNQVFSGALSATNDISFSTPTLGFGVGFSDYKKTTDGGNTWSETAIPFSGLFYAIDCPTDSNCHIVGGNGINAGTLVQTNNAGSSWTQSGITATTYTDLDFLNDTVGYACGYNGSIVKFTDGSLSILKNSLDNVLLYPNPATDNFTISIHENMINECSITLVNIVGETVYSAIPSQQKVTLNKDALGLRSGIYLVKINYMSSNKVIKLIVR